MKTITTIDAYPAMLARALGLHPPQIQELGGYKSDRQPRDQLKGLYPMHKDVIEALAALDDDVQDLAGMMIDRARAGKTLVTVYNTDSDLRSALGPVMPARGKAPGGFACVWNLAALMARDELHGTPDEIALQMYHPDA